MEGVRHRVTVLFENEEALEGAQTSGKGVLVKPDGVSVVQQRWIYAVDQDLGDVRITWRVPGADRERSVIDSYYAPGLNVYNLDKEYPHQDVFGYKSIQNDYYKIRHLDEWKDMRRFLPAAEVIGLKWRPEMCDYDIMLKDKVIQVNEYCPLKEEVEFFKDAQKTEIGLFYVDSADIEDVNLSGLRCTWIDDGDDINKCEKTTLFYKPAHVFPKNSNTSIEQVFPVGLHPKVQIDLTQHNEIPNCKYFLYNTLPVSLFFDKFQTPNCLVYGISDLEAPEYANAFIKGWGSEILVALEGGKMNEITFHSRYQKPGEMAGSNTVNFEPNVFLACDSSEEVAKNPFYAKNWGYESMFTKNTVFHHLNSTNISVDIPYPDENNHAIVEKVTFSIVLLAILYLLSKMLKFLTYKQDKGAKKQ